MPEPLPTPPPSFWVLLGQSYNALADLLNNHTPINWLGLIAALVLAWQAGNQQVVQPTVQPTVQDVPPVVLSASTPKEKTLAESVEELRKETEDNLKRLRKLEPK